MLSKFQYVALLAFLLNQTLSSCQVDSETITQLNRQLKNGETTVNTILSDDAFMPFHSLTPFREMIKSYATSGKLTMITAKEPGTKITVKGSVVDKAGQPQKNINVYVYQTSSKGWYSDTAAHILINSGDINHARLFGYLKTDDKGEFVIETIKPQGYPKSSLSGHIHIHFRTDSNRTLNGPGELMFEDDPRMNPLRMKETLEEGNLVAKNTGTVEKPVYVYQIVVDY